MGGKGGVGFSEGGRHSPNLGLSYIVQIGANQDVFRECIFIFKALFAKISGFRLFLTFCLKSDVLCLNQRDLVEIFEKIVGMSRWLVQFAFVWFKLTIEWSALALGMLGGPSLHFGGHDSLFLLRVQLLVCY